MQPPIPILRIFDERIARDFYIEFLEFNVEWEHRFCEKSPLYMEVKRDACVLHLSEHFGDATPGSAIRIETSDLDAYIDQLRFKDYRHCRPGRPEMQPWGLNEIGIQDPFGNRIIFFERPNLP